MKIRTYQRALLFLVVNVIACPLFTRVEAAQIEVLTSIRPLGLLAEAVVGNRGVVKVLLPKGASAHHYQLRYSDRKKLQDANIVLWIGEDLERFLVKPINQRQQTVITANTLPGIQWPSIESAEIHHHQDHHHSSDKNPHIWLNPLNNLIIVDHLVGHLSQLDQANAAVYQQNGDDLKAHLQQLDKQLVQQLAPVLTKGFVVNHPAYDHFIARYGLTQIAIINQSPESPLGARHLMKLRKEEKIHCVFGDIGHRSDAARQLAIDLKASFAYLDPLGSALTDRASLPLLIQRVAETFRECLLLDNPANYS